MRDFRQLVVWQKAHQLTLEVYRLTRPFPPDERFGLTSQLRRAVASIGANLAEGCGRSGRAEYAHFVSIASGSALETEYHLLLAKDLGYLAAPDYMALEQEILEIKRMLIGLKQHLKAPVS